MCFIFKKNNKQTKKPVNRFLQDDTGVGIQSLQTSIGTDFICRMPCFHASRECVEKLNRHCGSGSGWGVHALDGNSA